MVTKMQAVILAGGLGTRLRPLTYIVPKPMLPIGGKPLLERTISYLREYGITEIVICVSYLKRQIIDHFKRGSNLKISLRYAESESPLGTAGQLKTAEEYVKDTFLAMNGDIVSSLNLKKLIEFHKNHGGLGTIALKKYEVKIPYGYVETDEEDARITNFKEKPSFTYLANAGIYIFEPRIFEYIPPNKTVSLEHEIFPKLIAKGERLNGYYEEAFWADIGDLSDYERINAKLLEGMLGKI